MPAYVPTIEMPISPEDQVTITGQLRAHRTDEIQMRLRTCRLELETRYKEGALVKAQRRIWIALAETELARRGLR